MGSPQIFNFWGERKQQSPNDASVIHCDLLAERESTTKTFLRFSIAASAQQMHLLLPILVLCSAIFRRVFLALRSLREPLLQLRCHHLALATQLALAQKSTFLKISFSFTSLIPCPLPPRDNREKTEITTAQLPANKKCCLLIFTIAIGCLVLADFPASSLPVTLVHLVLPFPFLLAVLLCGVPETLVAFWGALCGSARENSPHLYTILFTPSTKKIALKAIFICIYAKKSVSLHPQFHAGGLRIFRLGFADILKRRLLRFVLTSEMSQFQPCSGLSNGRCPTGYRLILLVPIGGTSFAYMCMRARVP